MDRGGRGWVESGYGRGEWMWVLGLVASWGFSIVVLWQWLCSPLRAFVLRSVTRPLLWAVGAVLRHRGAVWRVWASEHGADATAGGRGRGWAVEPGGRGGRGPPVTCAMTSGGNGHRGKEKETARRRNWGKEGPLGVYNGDRVCVRCVVLFSNTLVELFY